MLEINHIFNGRILLKDIEEDVIAARNKIGYTKFAFTPATVDALIALIHELDEKNKELMEDLLESKKVVYDKYPAGQMFKDIEGFPFLKPDQSVEGMKGKLIAVLSGRIYDFTGIEGLRPVFPNEIQW